VAIALVVVIGTWIMYSLARNAAENGVGFKGTTLELGQAEDRAKVIERTGPLLWPALQGTTDIWVNRVEETWVAFGAAPEGKGRECNLVWDPAAKNFAGTCDQNRYPANGEGLTQYFITDRNGILVVDFRTKIPGPGLPPVGEPVTQPSAPVAN
jgi:hypothetical protein